jgi:hypothetical protein
MPRREAESDIPRGDRSPMLEIAPFAGAMAPGEASGRAGDRHGRGLDRMLADSRGDRPPEL